MTRGQQRTGWHSLSIRHSSYFKFGCKQTPSTRIQRNETSFGVRRRWAGLQQCSEWGTNQRRGGRCALQSAHWWLSVVLVAPPNSAESTFSDCFYLLLLWTLNVSVVPFAFEPHTSRVCVVPCRSRSLVLSYSCTLAFCWCFRSSVWCIQKCPSFTARPSRPPRPLLQSVGTGALKQTDIQTVQTHRRQSQSVCVEFPFASPFGIRSVSFIAASHLTVVITVRTEMIS